MEIGAGKPRLKQRDIGVDVLRGFAIVFMIIGHSIFFRFGLTSWPLNVLLNFANSFCYVTFLFTFGYGSYFFIVKPKIDEERKRRIEKRILSLVVMYYVAAIISIMSSYNPSLWDGTLVIHEIRRVIFLLYFPGFTEYLPSFAIYTIILYVMKISRFDFAKYLNGKRAALYVLATLIISVITNMVVVMNRVNLPSYLRLLVGSSSTYDFPVVQYLPVFLLGIIVAKFGSTKQIGEKTNLVMLAYLSLLSSLFIDYSFNITSAYGIKIEMINTSMRWPPSLLFLVSGISKTMLFFVVSVYLIKIEGMKNVWGFLNYMGRRSMGFLLYHLIVLFLMKIMQVPMFNMGQLILFLILIPLTYRLGEIFFTRKIVEHSTI